MHSHRSQASVSAFQGDTAIRLCITITDGGNIYKIEDGCVAILSGTKSDGSKLWDRCVIERDTIIYDFNEKTTNCTGVVNCEITLYGGDGRIVTAPKFVIVVDEREVPGDANVPSDGDSNTAIDVVLNAAAQVPQIEERVTAIVAQSEAWANESESHASDAKQHAELAMEEQTKAGEYADEINQRIGSLDFSYNKDTGELTFSYESDGETVTKSIDLPIESSIVELTEIKKGDKYYLHYKLASGYEDDIELDDIFSGLLEFNDNLEKQIANLDAEFQSAREDITNLQTESHSAREDITNLEAEAQSAREDITSLAVGLETARNNIISLGTESQSARKDILNLETENGILNKRISNLESATLDFIEDSSVAYQKTVPENALPYAEVTKIGGMTRKCTNLISPSYIGKTVQRDGGTLICNSDGSITASGTPTGNVAIALYNGVFQFPEKLSIKLYGSATNVVMQIDIRNADNEIIKDTAISPGSSFIANKTDYPAAEYLYIAVKRNNNNVEMSGTVYPMICAGDILPFETPFEGLRSAPVSELVSEGANLATPFNIGHGVDDGTGAIKASTTQACTDLIKINHNESYTWSNIVDTLFSGVYFYNENKEYLGRSGAGAYTQRVITSSIMTSSLTNIGGNICYIRLWCGTNTNLTGTIDLVAKQPPMLNKGTEALPYRPYFKRTLPIPEAVRTIDGYGWGVSEDCFNYIDYEKKQFVKRVACVDMGAMSWNYNSGFFANPSTSTLVGAKATNAQITQMLCRKYKNASYNGLNANTDKHIAVRESDKTVWVRDTDYTDVASFQSAMSGVMLYYELAEPEVTDISDVLTDDNFIEVEGDGSITAVNEYGYDVPTTINYITDIGE